MAGNRNLQNVVWVVLKVEWCFALVRRDGFESVHYILAGNCEP